MFWNNLPPTVRCDPLETNNKDLCNITIVIRFSYFHIRYIIINPKNTCFISCLSFESNKKMFGWVNKFRALCRQVKEVSVSILEFLYPHAFPYSPNKETTVLGAFQMSGV